jgi:hypothetical protein
MTVQVSKCRFGGLRRNLVHKPALTGISVTMLAVCQQQVSASANIRVLKLRTFQMTKLPL